MSQNHRLKIAICGPGGSGKDTVAAWFRDNTKLTYRHSTSWMARELVFEEFKKKQIEYDDAEACYDDRANHRRFWADVIDAYNADDPARLYKDCVKVQDIITGIRKKREFLAAQRGGVFQLSIWVLSNMAVDDATQEYGAEFCDVLIENHKAKSIKVGYKQWFNNQLNIKLTRLSIALGIYVPRETPSGQLASFTPP